MDVKHWTYFFVVIKSIADDQSGLNERMNLLSTETESDHSKQNHANTSLPAKVTIISLKQRGAQQREQTRQSLQLECFSSRALVTIIAT